MIGRKTNQESWSHRESLLSSRSSLKKIWVWFRAIRFVMCRQPQQKSGSKQSLSVWYNHHTVVAISLLQVCLSSVRNKRWGNRAGGTILILPKGREWRETVKEREKERDYMRHKISLFLNICYRLCIYFSIFFLLRSCPINSTLGNSFKLQN